MSSRGYPFVPQQTILGGDQADAFRKAIVAQKKVLFELSGSRPLSNLRDVQRTSGSATITDSTNGEYRLRHTTGGDAGSLLSAPRGRYIPGNVGEAGIGIRFEGTIEHSSSFAEWGYFDEDGSGDVRDGVLFGVDATDAYIRIVRNGTQTFKRYRLSTNNSGNVSWDNTSDYLSPLEVTRGRVYQFPYAYYGYGGVTIKVLDSDERRQDFRITDAYTYIANAETLFANPNLRIGARVGSTAGTDDFSVYVGGRKFAVYGDDNASRRDTGEMVTGISCDSTSLTPLMTFRSKDTAGFRSINLEFSGFDVIVATNPVEIQIRVSDTLDTASFATPSYTDATETAIEVDTTATAISSTAGTVVYKGLFPAGAGNRTEGRGVNLPQFQLPENTNLTIAARGVGGTATVDLMGRIEEVW